MVSDGSHIFHRQLRRSSYPPIYRGKSFPPQSNSYKAVTVENMCFEWLTDGKPCALVKPDEVARNGAFQE